MDVDDDDVPSDSSDNFIGNVVIEEVISENLPESELSEFVPLDEPLALPSTSQQYSNISETTSKLSLNSNKDIPVEQEEMLIKKLINGEMTFMDYNQQIGRIVDDNIDEEGDETDELLTTGMVIDEMPTSTLESSTNFEKELIQSRKDVLRGNLKGRAVSKDGKPQRRRTMLPVALQGLMGEANLSYARGEPELAEKVCLEIIRQVPLAPEPFLTLAQIYENNADKYMQFSLIAAHLNPSDIDQWTRIAQLFMEQGNIKQAINCYMKAAKYNNKNVDVRLRRIELLKMIGEDKLAFRCYCSLLPIIPAEQADFLLDTAKTVANQLLKDNNTVKALEAINCAYSKVPELFQTEDIHLYLELLITNAMFQSVVDVLCVHAGLEVTFQDESESLIGSCKIPDDIILDFRSKLIVSLIHLQAFHLLDYLIDNIFKFIDIENAGDCYLDIAEALMKEKRYENALTLLIPLVQSKNYSLAAVWLRHADCYRAMGEIEKAIKSYSQVVKLAPQHFDARLTLSALLKQIGKNTEAMDVLDQDVENEMIDPYVLYERCYMLKEHGDLDQYIDAGYLLLSRHCMKLRNREEFYVAATMVKFSMKIGVIKDIRKGHGEPLEDTDVPEFLKTDNEPTVLAEWELYNDILNLAYKRGRFKLMMDMTIGLKTAKRFVPYMKELDFHCLLVSLFNRDSHLTYVLLKEILVKQVHEPRVWNLFNAVLQFTDDFRYGKYILRLFKRIELTRVEPTVLRANYFLLSGSYKYAVNDYITLFKKGKSPMVPLLLAITYAHLAQQKNVDKKHSLITQSLAFATTYSEMREPEAKQEVHYNFGRLYQQFGINHLAVDHYNKALQFTNSLIKANEKYLCLRREIAFNLHVIYKASGNFALARKCLYDNIEI